jgi:mono/diheme cytochrome c family protein
MVEQIARKVIVLCSIVTVVAMLSSFAVAQNAESLYKSKCAVCHAADGSGNTPVGTKLAIKDLKTSKNTDAAWFDITKKGKGKMPAYENKLTDDQIKGLVKYIRGLGKTK